MVYSSSFQQFLWNTNEIYFLNYWYPKDYFVVKVEEDMIWTYWNVFHIFVHHWANISKAFEGTQDQLFHFAILPKGPHSLFVCFSYFWGTRSQLLSDLALLFFTFFGSLSCCCGYHEELSSSCFSFLFLSLSCLLYCCKELGSLWLPWHYFSPILACFNFVFCSYFHCIPIMRSLAQLTFDIVSFFLFVMFSSSLHSSILCFSSTLL